MTVESDVLQLQTDLASTDALLSAKSQEFTDTLAAHSVRIDVAQAKAVNADDVALDASTRVFAAELNARTYTDAEIQKLKDLIDLDLIANQTNLDASIKAYLDQELALVSPGLQAAIDTKLAQIQAIKDAVDQDIIDLTVVNDGILNDVVPVMDTLTSQLTTDVNAVVGRIDTLLTDNPNLTIKESLDDIRAENEENLTPLGRSVLRGPAAHWTRGTGSVSATLLKTAYPVDDGTFITDDPDFTEAFRFEGNFSYVIGSAYPINFIPGHVYKIEATFKSYDSGSPGDGLLVNLGVSTQKGTSSRDVNQQNIHADWTHTRFWISSGVRTVIAYYSTDAAAMTSYGIAADDQIVLNNSSDANKAYPHFRQNNGDLTNSRAILATLEITDVTEVLSAIDTLSISLTGSLGDVNARLDDDYLTIAQADTAIAAKITTYSVTVDGQFGSVNGNLTTNYNTKAQADVVTAAKIEEYDTTLQGELTTSFAALSSVYFTESQVDNAIAGQITNYEATITNIVANQLPSTFEEDDRFFTHDVTGAPDDVGDITNYGFKTTANNGRAAWRDTNGSVKYLMQKGTFTPIVGRTYRLIVRVDLVASGTDSADTSFSMFFRGLDSDYLNPQAEGFTTHNASASWATYTAEWTCDTEYPFMRAGLYTRAGMTGWEFRVTKILVEDITTHNEVEQFSVTASGAEFLAVQAKDLSVDAKDLAEDYAASALFSRNLTSRVAGGGYLDGDASMFATVLGWVQSNAAHTTSELIFDGGSFVGYWEYDTVNATANNDHYLFRNLTVTDGMPKASSVKYVEVEMDIEMISGIWNTARISVQWDGATTVSDNEFISEHASSQNGKIVTLKMVFERPDTFDGASGSNDVRFVYYASTSAYGPDSDPHSARIHRVQCRYVSVYANSLIQQKAITTLEGYAGSSIVLRAVAGGATGEVEIIAAEDVNGGTASKVSMTGDVIEFDGMSVFSGPLQSEVFTAGSLGWQINSATGDAEFNDLVVRGWMQDGSVSDGAYASDPTGQTIGANSSTKVAHEVNFGPATFGQIWQIAWAVEVRGDVTPGATTIAYMQIWDVNLSTWVSYHITAAALDDTWEDKHFVTQYYYNTGGADFKARIWITSNRNESLLTQTNTRRCHISGRSTPAV